MKQRVQSDFLVATPSVASGAGRLLDWWGTYDTYNVSRNGREADTKAMIVDWYMVGTAIHDAIVEFESTQPVK
jgi:hypothetical protein